MDLNLRDLRYFVAVAEAGTYTGAAADLHIATPSLSQQIRRLERQVGVRLLDRDHRGARLTPAGEEVLACARRMLAMQGELLAVGRRRARSDGATLRVGFLTGMLGRSTSALLDRVRDALPPGAHVDLRQVGWGEQVDAVLDGRVDAMLARPPLPGGRVRRVPLLAEHRVLVMSAGHPLAARCELRVADLAGVEQVDTDGVDEAWRAFWTLDPRPDGTRPTYGPTVHSVEEMLEVCARTACVGVTAAAVMDLYPRPDLAYRPIVDIPPTTVELVAAAGKLSPLTAELVTTARAWAAVAGPGVPHDVPANRVR